MPGAAWASAPAPADTTAPAADGPQLGKMQILQTDKGAVLSLPVTGSSDITSVTVTAAELGNPTQTYTFSLSLVSGAATDGTWQSTSPLGLPFGDYNFTGTAVDTNGRQITGSVYDSYDVYQPTIVFHGTTFSSNHLTIDSPTLARHIGRWRDEAVDNNVFVIGGADGLSPDLRRKAKLSLAFGRATWPHQMVRVMLLEQIYRAATILAGHPYHRS